MLLSTSQGEIGSFIHGDDVSLSSGLTPVRHAGIRVLQMPVSHGVCIPFDAVVPGGPGFFFS